MKKEVKEKIKKDLEEKKIVAIKNYKEMCKYLEEEENTNRTKKEKQIKEWSKDIKWERNNQIFIIKKIYENSFPEEESKIKDKLLNYNLCLILLENSIKDILEKTELKPTEMNQRINKRLKENIGHSYISTVNQLALRLGLINEYYLDYFSSPNKLSKYLDIDIKNIYEFYHKVSSYYKSDIKQTLERLEKNKVLLYNEIYRGKFVDGEERIVLEYKKDNDNDIIENRKVISEEEYRDLTQEECEEYITIQNELLKENDCKDFSEYIKNNKGNTNKFFQELNKRTYERLRCFNVYKAYKISFLPSFIFMRKKTLENKLTTLFANRITTNKLRDINRKIEKLCQDLDEQTKIIETLNILTIEEDNKKQNIVNKQKMQLKKDIKKNIKDLKQSYEDFRILTKELIKESKSEEK